MGRADQALAKGLQPELKVRETPSVKLGAEIKGRDGIAEVALMTSATLVERATVTLRFVQHPRLRAQMGHAIAMATPIAHKGATRREVQAMTILDLVTQHALVRPGWDYFRT